ncbi:MAG: ComEA family DNA-binding protein [Lachnospiraceae bacterium]|nr:ComEA family DNA-binding protein [Lachnospiraceae bacterium]
MDAKLFLLKSFIAVMFLTALLTGCGQNDRAMDFGALEESDFFYNENENLTKNSPDNKLCVYVCGAVKNPGVYELPENSRVNDALKAAGGLLPEGDEININLAKPLSDGERIYFPKVSEEGKIPQDDGLVDINHASVTQLCTLPGIGESRAGDIVAYRESNGPFKQKEDIMKVTGIKTSLFNKISDLITVK